jgi:hypothetical protein
MSGEGLSVSFRRTNKTTKSNQELLSQFKVLVYSNKKIMSHMKWYGKENSVELLEHGDKYQPYWRQENVAIKDSFQFYISVYESWGDNSNYYECHKTEGSFVSVAQKFALDYNLMYFPFGFPSEWIEQEIIDGEKNWNHFKVKPDDKNIDKICEIWHDYCNYKMENSDTEDKVWGEVKKKLKSIMNLEQKKNLKYDSVGWREWSA